MVMVHSIFVVRCQQISCDIRYFVCLREIWQNIDRLQLFHNKTVLCYQCVYYNNYCPAQYCGISPDVSQVNLRWPRRLSIRRYSVRFCRKIIHNIVHDVFLFNSPALLELGALYLLVCFFMMLSWTVQKSLSPHLKIHKETWLWMSTIWPSQWGRGCTHICNETFECRGPLDVQINCSEYFSLPDFL